MQTWLHRISYHAEVAHPLLERGYLTIGFSDFATTAFITQNPDFVSRTRSDGNYFDRIYEAEWDGKAKRTRWNLWYFLAEMKTGDRVVVPGFPNQDAFSVYEISEDMPLLIRDVAAEDLKSWTGDPVKMENGLLSREGAEIDLGFARKVRPVELGLSRSEFADAALTARMKIRMTTSEISDLQESVERALKMHWSNQPINLHASLLEQHTQATLESICRDLTPDKFEKLIAWYFRRMGATTVEIPPKNESGKEGDADVVATFDPLRTIIYVQAKMHTGITDDWAAQQIREYRDKKIALLSESTAMDDGYSRIAWVISTAEFAEECSPLARQNKILLLNGKDFARMILNAGIEGLNSAF
jgi:predicted Mrr-cat superfamily restriction endonuclease